MNTNQANGSQLEADPLPGRPAGATVVIPTFNREAFAIQAVIDLLQQDYAPLEILVIDQSPEAPELRALASAHGDVVSYHQLRERGVTRARNAGWQRSRYDTIVYIDDDVRCPPDFVSRHVEALAASEADIIAGGIEEPSRVDRSDRVGHLDETTARTTRGFASHVRQYVDHAPGGNFSMHRDLLRTVGGFDEGLEVGAAVYEETEFCLEARRLGYRILFEPDARLTHLVAARGGNRVPDRGRFAYGLTRNRALVVRRHIRRRSWPRAAAALVKASWIHSRSAGSSTLFLAGLRGIVAGFIAGGSMRRGARND